MQQEDREAIVDLFGRLREAEDRSGPREPEADALIHDAIAAQPAAPYYMAQTIVVQNHALAAAQQRIAELETASRQERGGGLFGGLFGSPSAGPAPAAPSPRQAPRSDGFLAGAAQTAFGVAGGVLLANLVVDSLFGGDAAAAPVDDAAGDAEPGADGDLDGGDFDIDF